MAKSLRADALKLLDRIQKENLEEAEKCRKGRRFVCFANALSPKFLNALGIEVTSEYLLKTAWERRRKGWVPLGYSLFDPKLLQGSELGDTSFIICEGKGRFAGLSVDSGGNP